MDISGKGRSLESLLQEFSEDPQFAEAWAVEQPKSFLAANITRRRHQLGITQAELAARIGVRQPRIAEIERGDANPQLETIAKLAYALQESVDRLLADPRQERGPEYRVAQTARLTFEDLYARLGGRWNVEARSTSSVRSADTANDQFALSA